MSFRLRDTGPAKMLAAFSALRSIRRHIATVGIHEDTGAQMHGDDPNTTVGEVAVFTEFGTATHEPIAWCRNTVDVDASQNAEALVNAGRECVRSAMLGRVNAAPLQRLANDIAKRMKDRVPEESGVLRDAIEGRVEEGPPVR